MSRLRNKNLRLLLLTLSLLTVSLACATAETLVNGTPTPVPTSTATLTPTPAETPTATAAPTVDWTPIACEGGDCIDACMARVEAILEISPYKDLTDEVKSGSTDYELATYPVNGNELGDIETLWAPKEYKIFQEDQDTHRRIWNYFTAVIPTEMRKRVDEFIVFTDGPRNRLAYVKPTSDDTQTWAIAFDILDSDYPPYLTETLVHEVGHLVTIDAAQLDTDNHSASACKTFLLPEGCSTKDSYISQFYKRFWPGLTDEWSEMEAAHSEAEYRILVENFYRRHSNEFVSSYAATSPIEDIAESWAVFVLTPKPEEKSVADEKVLFFYDFPELVTYRQQIIQGLCSYTQ